MKGHVRKRGKKWCFILDVGVDPNTGKRQQKWFSGFLTKKEAEKAMTKKLNEINSGTYVEPSKLTFEEFCHQWVDHYARSNCGELTLQGYEYIINQHFIPSLGKVRIDDLKTISIQNITQISCVTAVWKEEGAYQPKLYYITTVCYMKY